MWLSGILGHGARILPVGQHYKVAISVHCTVMSLDVGIISNISVPIDRIIASEPDLIAFYL